MNSTRETCTLVKHLMVKKVWRAGFSLGMGLLLLVCSERASAQAYRRFAFHRGLMGTQFNLIFYAPDSLKAGQVRDLVYARMDTLNQIMSDYLDGSELNRLSATAGTKQWVTVSPTLFDVLQKAQAIAQASNGRFDPTIGPLSLLWRRAVRRNEFPDKRTLRRARRAVGYRFVELDSTRRAVRLTQPRMRLDLGGIGQGYAIDEASEVLSRLGIRSALLDVGGDVRVSDPPPDQAGWRVFVGSGKAGETDTLTLVLHHAAVTTSGDTHRYLLHNGRRYSHIMNPRSGLGLQKFRRVTVLAPDGVRADALTKVFSVARDERESKRLLTRFPGVALYRIELKKGRPQVWKSAGFQ